MIQRLLMALTADWVPRAEYRYIVSTATATHGTVWLQQRQVDLANSRRERWVQVGYTFEIYRRRGLRVGQALSVAEVVSGRPQPLGRFAYRHD
jgi:hypothetical protein